MGRKLKVYGKKKGQDLVNAFEKLTVSSPSDRDAKNTGGKRDALSPTSHNIQKQRHRHEEETREKLVFHEIQPIQTHDALIHLRNSSIQNNTKEACDVSLGGTNKTEEGHQRQSWDKDGWVEHSSLPRGRRNSNSRENPAGRSQKATLVLGEPVPIPKENQHEALCSEQQKASILRARSKRLRNAVRDRKDQSWKSTIGFDGTGVEWKGKAKSITAHGAPEKSSNFQGKALSPQNSRPHGSSGIAPPRTLRSTRRGRDTLDPTPVRELTLDQKQVEYLKPLTELVCVSRTRDIQKWHAEWTSLCTICKIAEGSYGSVFRMSDKKNFQSKTIGKLMPLKARSGVGSRRASNTAIETAASEVKLLELMSDVPGFVAFRDAEVLIGALPRALRGEYRAYTGKKNGSNCESSGAETWFPNHQAWLFIEMDDAGVELDDALTGAVDGSGLLQLSMTGQRFLTVKRTRDIFWGVVGALMKGEQMHRFEHRDLHLSNICVELNKGKELDSGYELIPPTTNVNVTIIDYTLSRATMPDDSLIFNPMSDESIFQGDGTVDLQFDIYRHMREVVANSKASNKGWDVYVPITNVLWLSFLLRKLMQWTPRPEEIGEEQELWQSLDSFKLALDLDYRWSWDLLSACDVARYMQVGKQEFWEDIKEQEGWKERRGDTMESIRVRRQRILSRDDTAE